MTCKHTEFEAHVAVVILEDAPGHYAVDVRVHCVVCLTPLYFVGLPVGVMPDKPTVSVDGTEARLRALDVDEESFLAKMHRRVPAAAKPLDA